MYAKLETPCLRSPLLEYFGDPRLKLYLLSYLSKHKVGTTLPRQSLDVVSYYSVALLAVMVNQQNESSFTNLSCP